MNKKEIRIPQGWKLRALKDAGIVLQQGFASGDRDDNGILQLRMNNITTDGRIVLDSTLKVPIPSNIQNYLLKKDDIIFNNTNSISLIGKTAIVREEKPDYTFSNHLSRIRANKEILNPLWLLYQINLAWRNNYWRNICNRHVNQAGIRKEDIEKFQILIPPIQEQQVISLILSNVDNIINQTQQLINHLNLLKKGLMQHLFTQGIGHSEFKETKIGKIPKEWEIVRLGDIVEIIMGQSPPSSTYNSEGNGLPFFQGNADFGFRHPKVSVWCSQPIKKTTMNDIVVSVRAPVGELNIINQECCIGRGLSAIRTTNEILGEYLYQYLDFNKSSLLKLSQGSTFSAINKADLERILIGLPTNDSEMKNISIVLRNIDDLIKSEKKHNKDVIETKTGLMQNLLTGKKRVPIAHTN